VDHHVDMNLAQGGRFLQAVGICDQAGERRAGARPTARHHAHCRNAGGGRRADWSASAAAASTQAEAVTTRTASRQ